MKVVKERNNYLSRNSTEEPHKYGFKLDSGKHFLLSSDGSERTISKIGTFTPKFRKQFTGFASPKQRVIAAKTDSTALHFTPDSNYPKQNTYYTPYTRKFKGYAQQPYELKRKLKLNYLDNPDECHNFYEGRKGLGKSLSQKKQAKNPTHMKNISSILDHSQRTFISKEINDQFYQKSFSNQTFRKPLPKEPKKTCYNYRCKNQQYFTFDEKEKTKTALWSQFVSVHGSGTDSTRCKSFHDRILATEKKELETLKSTGF